MEKAITSKSLALENIRRKPYRTAALISLIALSSAVLFATLILAASLKAGIYGIQSRIGADLMIVPEGYEADMEGVLLSGQPSYFYLSKDLEEIVKEVEGVEKVTSQFYLTSLSESCCDFPIQIIGFDEKTDFIVKYWAKKKLPLSALSSEEIILAGSNISTEKNKVTFFSTSHQVSAKLAKSGSGLDNVIFVNLPALQKMYEAALAKGFGFISDGDSSTKTSVIFVKLKEGYKSDGLALKIKNAIGSKEKIQIIQSQKFVSNFAKKLSSFLIFIYINCILVFLISVLTLGIVLSLSINERLREFSILRVLGADYAKLRSIIFSEARLLGSIGALSGLFITSLILLPFNIIIAEKLSLPFAMSSPSQIILFALAVFFISLASCLLASLFSAVKISRLEIYGEAK